MALLPSIPGLEVLVDLGGDAITRRYQVRGDQTGTLVLFGPSIDPEAVLTAAHRWQTVRAPGLASIERLIRWEDQTGFIIADGGAGGMRNPWDGMPMGELEALPILHRVTQALCGLHTLGHAHGAVKPAGLGMTRDGSVLLLPPVPIPLPEDRSTFWTALSPAGRDLAAVGDLACHLIGALRPLRIAGVGSRPAELQELASPATAEAVRLLLEAAVRCPSPGDAGDLLRRIGWGRESPTPRLSHPLAGRISTRSSRRRVEERPTVKLAVKPGTPSPRSRRDLKTVPGGSRRRLVLVFGVIGGVTLVAGSWFAGGSGDVLRRSWLPGGSASRDLPEPADPMARIRPAHVPRTDIGTQAESVAGESSVPGRVERDALVLADEILAGLARSHRSQSGGIKKNYDRTLIDAGDQLRDRAKGMLAALRHSGRDASKTNATVKRAVELLEQARDKYLSFSEQFPARDRLVQSSIEEVNSMIFFAYRQRKIE